MYMEFYVKGQDSNCYNVKPYRFEVLDHVPSVGEMLDEFHDPWRVVKSVEPMKGDVISNDATFGDDRCMKYDLFEVVEHDTEYEEDHFKYICVECVD